MPIEIVIEAAKLAGAHEFICELPEGYDTRVGEHGSGYLEGNDKGLPLPGLSYPIRAFLFLMKLQAPDYESEKIIQENMRKICAGRTVLIIAHRLSAVRDANRLL